MSEPIFYDVWPYHPAPRKVRLGRWVWAITEGMTGPRLANGATVTRWGANRQRARAMARCRRRPHHIVRIEHPPLHPLSRGEAAEVSRELRAEGVQVFVRRSGATVLLCPLAELTTWERVHALRVVTARTDAPVRWRKAVARG